MKKKILASVLIFLLVVTSVSGISALTACTQKAATSTASTTSSTASTTSVVTPAAGTPQYGGTLTVMTQWGSLEPPGFDCDLAPAVYETTAWDGPFLGWLLVGDIDTYGPRGTNAFAFQTAQDIPDNYLTGQIAQSWEVTANPVTITFNIRPGIMWAGNTLLGMASRELTAADVAYSLTRGMAAPIVSGTYGFVTSVTAPSKYTAVVNCSSFNVNWEYFIAYGYMVGMITCPESGNSTVGGGSEDWHNQVSDGPFIITNYVEGSECTYERNPNYWGKTTINGKSYNLPFIDTLEYPIIPEEATTVAALRTGKIDWWPYTPNTYATSLKQTSPTMLQVPVPEGNVWCINVDRLTNQYLKNLAVRQALETATDFKSIDSAEFPGGAVMSYPIDPQDPAYTPLADLPASTQSQFSFNPTLAKQMLASAGYPNGFSLTLQCDSSIAVETDIAQFLVSEWANVGVTLSIDELSSAALTANFVNVGSYDLIFHQYNVNNPVTSEDNVYNGGQNTTNQYLSTEPFSAAYLTILGDTDSTKLVADEKQLAQAILADAGFIPFANPVELNCYWPWVKNYFGETDAGYSDLQPMISEMWIDQSLKN